MALSEIEKLERRYAENPQGLTFAPLAEVHRKNGDVARALELLRPGLTLHPDYIPASIVLGRCHLDLGDLPSAEGAFTHVLALDGENVIALKALADITERLVRFDEAERWLRTLLAIDRSNDEARDQLGRVETARRQAEVASAASPEAILGTGEVLEIAHPVETAGEAPASAAGAPLAFDDETATAEAAVPLALESLDLSIESGSPPEGIEVELPVTLEEPVQPLAGLVGRSDRPDPGLEPLDVADEFRVETAEDIVLQSSGGGEFQVANAAEELLTSRGFREPEPPPAPPPPWAAPVAEAPVLPEPDLLVTESMAELLARQGHPGEALKVYRHLESRQAGEPRFRTRIAELERAVAAQVPSPAAESVPEPTVEPAAEAPAPAYSVLQTQGQSVQAFLRGVLGARLPASSGAAHAHPEPPRAAAADPDGAPTRPAHDSLTLSSVFGEESTPTPPAVSASGSGTGGGGQGGVSYDEFFGAPGASTTPRAPRAPDSKTDDLDQFHAWLQNLKR